MTDVLHLPRYMVHLDVALGALRAVSVVDRQTRQGCPGVALVTWLRGSDDVKALTAKADAWLAQKFPDYRNPTAYWDNAQQPSIKG